MEYQRKTTTFMTFKPVTKYFTASEMSLRKPMIYLKSERGGEKLWNIEGKAHFNILAFMGFKPMISNKIFSNL